MLEQTFISKFQDIGYEYIPGDELHRKYTDVLIEDGSYVGKGAIVNSKSKIGKMCIVNSGAVVEHGNRVGDFTHVSVGAVLCGNVMVGDHVFVGANATVVQGVNIQAYSSIGAGTIVLKDVPNNTKVYGIWNGK